MKKILIVASTMGHIASFYQPYLDYLSKKDYIINVAGKDNLNSRNLSIQKVHKKFNIDFYRFPFNFKNIRAFFQIKKTIDNENYDLVHCNTPVAAIITRIAFLFTRNLKTKIIYTVHGFHFYKGSLKIYWILYYPLEKFLSRFTDTIIAINQEDFMLAKTKFKTNIVYLPGVGIKEPQEFKDKNYLKIKYNLSNQTKILLSVGELNKNKNHEVIIRSLSKLRNNENISYIICGIGKKKKYLTKLISKLNLDDKVFMFGFIKPIDEIFYLSDIFIHSSYREGLPVSLMQAMSYGLPVIASNIRGNKDLIDHGHNGLLFNPNDEHNLAELLNTLVSNEDLINKFSKANKEIYKDYLVDSINANLFRIYNQTLESGD